MLNRLRQFGAERLFFVSHNLLANGNRFVGNLNTNLPGVRNLWSAVLIRATVGDRQPDGHVVCRGDFQFTQIDGQFSSKLRQHRVLKFFRRRWFVVLLRIEMQLTAAEVIDSLVGDVDVLVGRGRDIRQRRLINQNCRRQIRQDADLECEGIARDSCFADQCDRAALQVACCRRELPAMSPTTGFVNGDNVPAGCRCSIEA